jgi:DNA-binding NtrC family response regulator
MQHAPPSLLAIDDDQGILIFLSAIASAEGYGVVTTMEACEAMERLRHNPADLVLLDLRMPGVEGLEALRGVRQASPRSRIVMMTGFGRSILLLKPPSLAQPISSRNHLTFPGCAVC